MTTEIRDCYHILGVPKDAGRELIKSARDKALREFHPDMFPDHREEVKAVAYQRNAEIEVAYQILTEKHKREEHDRILAELEEVIEKRERGEATDVDVNEVMEMLEDLILTALRDFLYKRSKNDQEKAALTSLISEKDPPLKWDFSTFDWSEQAIAKTLHDLDERVKTITF
jgi:DnaJ-class molecular chaperone